MIRQPRGSRLFTRYFLSYCLILLISFLMGAVLYTSSVKSVEDSAKKSAEAILEQTRDIVDTHIKELDSTAKQLTMSPQTHSFLAMDKLAEGSPRYYLLWNYWNELPNYSLANSFISSFYIIPRNAGVIVSAEEIVSDDQQQYDREFHYRNWDYAKWRSYLFSEPHNHEFLPGAILHPGKNEGEKGIFYLQTLPLETIHSPNGVFLVFINENSLTDLLKRLDTGMRGLVLVSDQDGQVVAGIAGEQCPFEFAPTAKLVAGGDLRSFEKSGFIVSNTVSSTSGWSYTSILPEDMVLAGVNRIRNNALAIFGLSAIIGIVAAALLARHSLEPIWKIAKRVDDSSISGGPTACRDELEFIDRAFDGLMAKNAGLRTELERQAPVIRADVTKRLLHGLYGNEAEAFALVHSADMAVDNKSFSAAVIRIAGYREEMCPELLDELKIVRAAITNTLFLAKGCEAHTTEEEENLVGVLFLSDKGEAAHFKSIAETTLNELTAMLAADYHVSIRWAMDNVVDTIDELPQAYSRARHLLGDIEAGRLSRIDFGSPEGPVSFFFPIETELRLVAAIRGADSKALHAILQELAYENTVARTLSARMFQDFAAAFRVAVVRGFGDSETWGGSAEATVRLATETAEALASIATVEKGDWFAMAEKHLMALLDKVTCSRKLARKDLADSIAAWLEEAYPDPSLTLYSVAKEFDFSESSFYRFFRETFGQSFSDYLENLRIRKACARLDHRCEDRGCGSFEGTTIKEVAAAVGFASDTTFRRAFHRVVGSSPSEYVRASGHPWLQGGADRDARGSGS